MVSYFCDGRDLVLRDCPAGELFVDALEDLVADVDHLGSAERRVLHAHVHALGCWNGKKNKCFRFKKKKKILMQRRNCRK
jgi:hypothetical protein